LYPFRDLNLFAGVPAGPIYYQKDALVLSGSHLFGELLIECHREQLHIDRGQDQPV